MKTDVIIRNHKDLEKIEAQLVQSAKTMANDVAQAARRCLDDRGERGATEAARRFLMEYGGTELGCSPHDGKKTSAARQVTSTLSWLASIAAVRWLLKNRRDISAYRMSAVQEVGVRIVSESPKKALEARALKCANYDLVSLLTHKDMDVVGFVQDATGGKARAKYVFATLLGAAGEEFEEVKKQGGIVIMVQRELARLAQAEKEVA